MEYKLELQVITSYSNQEEHRDAKAYFKFTFVDQDECYMSQLKLKMKEFQQIPGIQFDVEFV